MNFLVHHILILMQGLINALNAIVPNAEHRFCVMHLYTNMYKDHKGVGCRALLWLAARSTTEYMFKKHMTELEKVRFFTEFQLLYLYLLH